MAQSDINKSLYQQIETEIAQNKKANYYKTIAIHSYDRTTKRTLDLLVEKYGGFIYRDDHQVTLLINFSNLAPKHQTQINRKIFRKITELEQRLNDVVRTIQELKEEKSTYYARYADYFPSIEDIKHDSRKLQELIDEVIQNKEV